MRTLRGLVAFAVLFVACASAHADSVSFIVTEDASGSVGNQTFTDVPLTLTLSYTAAQFNQILTSGQGVYGPNDFQFGPYFGETGTMNIAGIGTFTVDLGINSALEGGSLSETDDVGDLGLPFTLDILDFTHSVGPVTQTVGYTDPRVGCVQDMYNPCPPYFYTGSSDLVYITSLGGTWTQEFIVGSSIPTPTPEPSTIVLIGTGVLGMTEMVRRRFSRT